VDEEPGADQGWNTRGGVCRSGSALGHEECRLEHGECCPRRRGAGGKTKGGTPGVECTGVALLVDTRSVGPNGDGLAETNGRMARWSVLNWYWAGAGTGVRWHGRCAWARWCAGTVQRGHVGVPARLGGVHWHGDTVAWLAK
jgi:hypothetical protein